MFCTGADCIQCSGSGCFAVFEAGVLMVTKASKFAEVPSSMVPWKGLELTSFE